MSKKAPKLMAKALKAIQHKQPDQAIDLLNQVLVLEPENAMVHHNLGVLYFDEGNGRPGHRQFRGSPAPADAITRTPCWPCARRSSKPARSASGKKEYEKANAYLLKLDGLPRPASGEQEPAGLGPLSARLSTCSTSSSIRRPLSISANARPARAWKKTISELYANATYFLGMITHIQGQYVVSNEHFKKYIALYAGRAAKPEFFAHANYFIGANLFRLLEEKLAKGDVAKMSEAAQEILPYLNTAVEMKLPSEDAYVMLGNCYVYLKEYDKAMADLPAAVRTFPAIAAAEKLPGLPG